MNYDNKLGLYITISILSILVIALGGYIVYDKYLSNEEPNTNTQEELEVTVRSYRFFGYDMDNGPDMYTTLRLYSDGKYTFYINNCEGVTKYSGNYTENDTTITLAGDKSLTIDKMNAGNSLDIDYTKIGACHDSGGTFSLENYILGE